MFWKKNKKRKCEEPEIWNPEQDLKGSPHYKEREFRPASFYKMLPWWSKRKILYEIHKRSWINKIFWPAATLLVVIIFNIIRLYISK